METLRRFLENDRFAKHAGFELIDVKPGYAKTRMIVAEQHLNGVGIAHGGAIFSLADFAFAAASNSHGTVAVAINVTISFMKAIPAGAVLTAEARETSRNPKLATYEIEVRDGAGDLAASFHGMVYRKKDLIGSCL
jgi:acyl-CoA thioesterase